jgi:thymidylate synthase
LYLNHSQQADLQISRKPMGLPTLKLNPEIEDIFDFQFDDIELIGYEAQAHIKAPIAV